eukprot:345732-Pelagomonas_calceolata.AAC.3
MEQPYSHQVSVQAVYDFLLQHNNKPFLDQSQADQPNILAEGLPINICLALERYTMYWHPVPKKER